MLSTKGGRRRPANRLAGARAERLEGRRLLSVVPLGDEFRVHSSPTDVQSGPRVAANAAGNSVVAWTGRESSEEPYSVYAVRYDAAGDPVGGEFRVVPDETMGAGAGSVWMEADGDFTVVGGAGRPGEPYRPFARRYGADGAPRGDLFFLDAPPGAVATNAAGNFLVVWYSPDGGGVRPRGYYARPLDAAGNATGDDVLVTTTGEHVTVAAGPGAGGFVVTWHEDEGGPDPNDGLYTGVRARRFDAAGAPAGGVIEVNQTKPGGQGNASAAVASDGAFIVTWVDSGAMQNRQVYARRYDAAGNPTTGEF